MSAALSFALAVLTGLSVLALGSNRPLPWSYNAILAGVILLGSVGALFFERKSYPPLQIEKILLPLMLIFTAMIWVGVQISSFGGSLVPHPAWQLAGETLGSDIVGSISVNRVETIWSFLRWLTAAVVFLAAFVLARKPGNARIMVRTFLVLSAVSAIYGMYRLFASSTHIMWYPENSNHFLSSGFVNRNNAATYFGMCVLITQAWLTESWSRLAKETEGQSWRGRLRHAAEGFAGGLGVDVALFLLFLFTLMLTGSRGGILFTLVCIVMLFAMHGLRGKRRGQSRKNPVGWFLGIVLVAVLGVLLLELSGATLARRLVAHGVEDVDRIDTYRQAIAAIRDYVLLGSGLGTFQDVYPAYRLDLSSSQSVWDKAHNDYLEILLGLGLPAALLALFGLFGFGFIALKGYFNRHRDRVYPASAFAVCALVALHSLTDFSLQIQANTMAFALVLGVGLAQSFSSRR